MKSKLRLFFKEESGVAVIFLAISMVVLMGFTALAVDFGLVYYQRSQLQTALDSAALAAAQKLPDTAAARQTAIEYAKKNGVKVNSDDEIFVEFLDSDSIVRVTASQETKTSFAKVFNVDTIGSVATAAAQSKEINVGQQDFDYLLFSGSSDIPLNLNGVGTMNVYGSIHTNNKYNIDGGVINIFGEVSGVAPGSYYNSGNSKIYIASTNPNASYIPMPDFSDSIAAYVPPFPTETAASNFSSAENKLNPDDVNYISPSTVNNTSAQYLTLTGRTGYNNKLDLKIWDTTTIVGEIYVKNGAKFQRHVVMNASTDLLCVDGDLQIDGSLTGKGTIIVSGNLNVSGASSFKGDIYVGGNTYFGYNLDLNGKLISKGNVTVNGFFNLNGINSNVPGVLYCDGNLRTNNTYKGKADVICQGTVTLNGGNVEHDGLFYSAKAMNFNNGLISNNITLLCKESITIQSRCNIAKGVIYAGDNFNCNTALVGSAYVFAENDLNYRGQANNNTQIDIAFYAINGNISISLSKTVVTGIIYAPKGNIHLGGIIDIYGNMIANSFSGGVGTMNIRRNLNGNPLNVSKTVNRIVLVQ
jgi:Flp pilus assembly protein TadG